MNREAISTEKSIVEIQRERDAEKEEMTRALAEREKKIEELQRELESARDGESLSIVEVEKMQTVITEMRAQKQLDDITIREYDHTVKTLTAANKELEERVLKAHLEGREVQEAIMKMREGFDGQKNDRGVLAHEQEKAQSQIVQLNKVIEQVQQWRSESHARVVELEAKVKTLQKSNDDLMRKEKSRNQKTVQDKVQILQRREDKARIEELEKKVENQKIELKAWQENGGSKLKKKNDLRVAQEEVSRLKNAMQTSETAHRKSLEEAEEKIRGLEKRTLCDCKGDGEKKTNPSSTATEEEIQILQCTRDGDRIRELEEKVKEMQRTIDDFQKREKSNNGQDGVRVIPMGDTRRIKVLEEKVKNQRMELNILKDCEGSKGQLKRNLKTAEDKVKCLKNAMQTAESAHRKSLEEAEEKIRGLERRTLCSCRGDEEKTEKHNSNDPKSVENEVQILQCTRSEDRIRELEEKVKNQKMTIHGMQVGSIMQLKKYLLAAQEEVRSLKNAMQTAESAHRKRTMEDEEKIRGLEKRRRCDCEAGGEKKIISDDLEEEVQKMREAVRKSQESMEALSSVICGEIPLVGGSTVTSQPGLVQKMKSLEEMCHSKDSVIDAMKDRAIITEYELVQLRDIVRLNAREPLGVV